MNIAITGKMRSGKDVISRYLCEKYGYTKFAFGDELKRYADELFGVHGGGKRRELYQWFGQTMRERDPDIWVRKCFELITEAAENTTVVCEWLRVLGEVVPEQESEFRPVISDMRQPNEYDRCRTEGFVIIRVTAPEGLRIQRAVESSDVFDYADLKHDTESHVDSFDVDYEIHNDGSLEDLYAQIDAIMAEISRK